MTPDENDTGTDDSAILEESLENFAQLIVETSPFSSEDWTENNGRPREW